MHRLISLIVVILPLAGCMHGSQAVDITSVPLVQADLKRQIGVYLAASAAYQANWLRNHDPASAYWCGDGSLDFQITTVKLDLATTVDKNNQISASATIPFVAGGAAGSVAPSVGSTDDITNSQEMIYTQYTWNPLMQPGQLFKSVPTPNEIEAAPIAVALIGLRNGLISAAHKSLSKSDGPQACFSDVPIQSLLKGADRSGWLTSSDNTFKIGISVVNDPSSGITVKLGILNFSNTSNQKTTTSNNITVTFIPVHIEAASQPVAANSLAVSYLHPAAYMVRPIQIAEAKPASAPAPAKDAVPAECKITNPPPSCFDPHDSLINMQSADPKARTQSQGQPEGDK